MCAPDQPQENVDSTVPVVRETTNSQFMDALETGIADELHRFIGIEIKRCALLHEGQRILFDCEEITVGTIGTIGTQSVQYSHKWSAETLHMLRPSFVHGFSVALAYRFVQLGHVMRISFGFPQPSFWPFSDGQLVEVDFPPHQLICFPFMMTSGNPTWRVKRDTNDMIELSRVMQMRASV